MEHNVALVGQIYRSDLSFPQSATLTQRNLNPKLTPPFLRKSYRERHYGLVRESLRLPFDTIKP
jgi:hypothetical protein